MDKEFEENNKVKRTRNKKGSREKLNETGQKKNNPKEDIVLIF